MFKEDYSVYDFFPDARADDDEQHEVQDNTCMVIGDCTIVWKDDYIADYTRLNDEIKDAGEWSNYEEWQDGDNT